MTVERTKKISPNAQKTRANTLVVDLKDLKAPWTAWCLSQNLTPSEAVRRALSEILRNGPGSDRADVEADRTSSGSDRKRLELRVSSNEFVGIASAAANEGMSVPRWIHALLIVHLVKRAQFGAPEVEALARSNQALLAIGRGLNQLIRERSITVPGPDLNLAQIVFLADLIKSHSKEVSQLLNANARRWAP